MATTESNPVTADDLPWPDAWPRKYAPSLLMRALVFAFGLFFVVFAIAEGVKSNALWLAVAGIPGLVIVVLAPKRPRDLAASLIDAPWLGASRAVVLPVNRRMRFGLISAAGLGGLGMIVGGGYELAAEPSVLNVLATTAGVGAVAAVARGLRGRNLPRGLALTPYGVRLATVGPSVHVPWSAVRGIGASAYQTPGATQLFVNIALAPDRRGDVQAASFTRALMRLNRGFMGTDIGQGLATVAAHPALVLHALEFYFSHPKLRHELESEAGARRINECQLTD